MPLVVLDEPRLPPKTAVALASLKPLLRGRERRSRGAETAITPRAASKPVVLLTSWEGGASKRRRRRRRRRPLCPTSVAAARK